MYLFIYCALWKATNCSNISDFSAPREPAFAPWGTLFSYDYVPTAIGVLAAKIWEPLRSLSSDTHSACPCMIFWCSGPWAPATTCPGFLTALVPPNMKQMTWLGLVCRKWWCWGRQGQTASPVRLSSGISAVWTIRIQELLSPSHFPQFLISSDNYKCWSQA